MFDAILWGLIQGLTEFLPVSSSGHLILIPDLLGREPPDLVTSAALHLGTRVAVLIYFRSDIMEVLRFTAEGKRLLRFLVIGTIPVVILGLALAGPLEEMAEYPRLVAVAVMVTGVILLGSRLLPAGSRRQQETGDADAATIGLAQAFALIPGISRSGSTIVAGQARRFEGREAASLAFLLGIPAIAGAGLLSVLDLAGGDGGGGLTPELLVGMVVAGLSGYAAIAFLLRLIPRIGLTPFGVYCLAFGAFCFLVL